MFRKLNNYFTYIPILLVWEYLFLFIFRNTDWYSNNFYWIDNIDNFLVSIVIIHFLCYIEIYEKNKIYYVLSIFLNIQLQFLYFHIPENIYFLIYLLLISFPIIKSII